MSISDRGRAPVRTLITVVLATVGVALLAIPAWQHWREVPPQPAPPLRLTFEPPSDLSIGAGPDYPFGLAVSPDGRRLSFPAARAGVQQLWLTELTTGSTDPLPGSDGAVLPFWSPDGRELAFFASGRLQAYSFADGSMRALGDAPAPRGGVWLANGDILFAPATDGALVRRRASDGGIEPWSTLDTAASETGHRHPVALNNGRHIVFFVRASEPSRQGVWIAPLDAPSSRKRLAGSDAHAIGMKDRLLLLDDTALVSQRVAFDTLTLEEAPQLIATSVGHSAINQLFATLAGDVLVYGAPASTLRELRWTDRAGVAQGRVGEPMDAWDVRIAPLGNSVAVTRLDAQLGTLDIWTYDGSRPLPRRISPAIDVDESPVWARDATKLAWVTSRRAVTTRGAMAQLAEEPVRKFERAIRLSDWASDGQSLLVTEPRQGTNDDVWIVPVDGSNPRVYVQSPFNERQSVVSPDGHWIAYASDESGRFEIYVDSFPNPGKRARLTVGGGTDPRWRNDGREVFFRRGTEIHVVTVAVSEALPEALSSTRLFDAVADLRAYDVTPDGQRFLLNVPERETVPHPITVVVNAAWR